MDQPFDFKGNFPCDAHEKGIRHKVLERHPVTPALRKQGIICDLTIAFTSERDRKRCPYPVRWIGFKDPDTGRRCVFLTTNFKLSPATIANIHKSRWHQAAGPIRPPTSTHPETRMKFVGH